MELALNCSVARRYHTFRTASNGEWIKLAQYCAQFERMELALKCPVVRRYHSFRTESNGAWIKLAHYCVQW